MPLYTYFRESTEEFVDIFQGMNDVHEYKGVDGDEQDWKRVYYSPQMAIDTQIDPFSSKQFNDRTRDKKGTVGHMLDYSAEMSDKRASQAGGVDPVKQKYFDNYAKERRGSRHQLEKQTFEGKNFKVDYGKD
jgi:hypothetical protein